MRNRIQLMHYIYHMFFFFPHERGICSRKPRLFFFFFHRNQNLPRESINVRIILVDRDFFVNFFSHASRVWIAATGRNWPIYTTYTHAYEWKQNNKNHQIEKFAVFERFICVTVSLIAVGALSQFLTCPWRSASF